MSKNERTSSALTAGRLEVFHNGCWGTVCSDGFSTTDADVLCQKLTGSESSRLIAYGEVGSSRIGYVIVY